MVLLNLGKTALVYHSPCSFIRIPPQTAFSFTIISGAWRHYEGFSQHFRGTIRNSMWSYKVDRSEHFDLVGNSLAILTDLASPTRAKFLISWIEKESEAMQQRVRLLFFRNLDTTRASVVNSSEPRLAAF
jgi:hypothetical protein